MTPKASRIAAHTKIRCHLDLGWSLVDNRWCSDSMGEAGGLVSIRSCCISRYSFLACQSSVIIQNSAHGQQKMIAPKTRLAQKPGSPHVGTGELSRIATGKAQCSSPSDTYDSRHNCQPSTFRIPAVSDFWTIQPESEIRPDVSYAESVAESARHSCLRSLSLLCSGGERANPGGAPLSRSTFSATLWRSVSNPATW
jgi:hypothetical protein